MTTILLTIGLLALFIIILFCMGRVVLTLLGHQDLPLVMHVVVGIVSMAMATAIALIGYGILLGLYNLATHILK